MIVEGCVGCKGCIKLGLFSDVRGLDWDRNNLTKEKKSDLCYMLDVFWS